MQVCRADSVGRLCDLSYQLLYDVFSLLVTVAWLAVGTHAVADLHLRKNYATHNPNQDVGNIYMRSPPEEPHLAVRLVFFLGDFSCLS